MASDEQERKVFHPNTNRARKKYQKYDRYLASELKKGGADNQGHYLQQAYQTIGQRQQQANRSVDQSLAGSFGINTPTGLKAALYAQNMNQADYPGARVMAERMGQQRQKELWNERQGNLQKRSNYYGTMINPYIQWMLGLGQIDANAATTSASIAAAAED